jgi:hypothetical protein
VNIDTSVGIACGLLAVALFVAAVVVDSIGKSPRVAGYLLAASVLVVYPVSFGFAEAGKTTRTHSGVIWIPLYVIAFAFCCIVPLIVLTRLRRFRPVVTAFVLIYGFALLLELFSSEYWSYGTTRNFTRPLSHLDAFYFALGTLTTAGTGNISATSETSRGIQALQMGLDLIFIGFVVTLVVTRYSTLSKRSPQELVPSGEAAAEPAHPGNIGEQAPDASEPDHPPADQPPDEHEAPEDATDTTPHPLRPLSRTDPDETIE